MREFLIAALCAAAYGQTFDAASVKVAPPSRMAASGPPWREGVGRLRQRAEFKTFIREAYGVEAFQIEGPGWMETDSFDIQATMPPETTREQLRAMMRNLLADRFKLAVHRETKQQQIYALVVARNGPKLKTAAAGAVSEPKGDEPELDSDGFPNPANWSPGVTEFRIDGRSRINGRQANMKDLAAALVRRLGRPVADETNLTSKYDFVLNYSGFDLSAAPATTPMPDLYQALEAQLGLKLESRKGPVETIVVDRVERVPTGN